jgi:hypothetical protein
VQQTRKRQKRSASYARKKRNLLNFVVPLLTRETINVFGLLLGMIDQRLRLLLDPRQEVLAADLEAVIDPAIQVLVAAEGEIALENDSIMAAEHGYNRLSELLREVEVRRHGVLLQAVW